MKTKKKTEPDFTIDPELATRLRKCHLEESYGSSGHQKSKLVEFILTLFQNPENWPISDAERIQALRELYRRCQTIKEMERLKL